MHSISTWIISFLLLALSLASQAQMQVISRIPELDSLISLTPQFRDEALVDHLNLMATTINKNVGQKRLVPIDYTDSCLLYVDKALDLARFLGYDWGEADALWNRSLAYWFKFDLKQSLVNYLEAIKLLESYYGEEIHANLGSINMQIANVSSFSSQYYEAEKYYKKALEIYNKLDDFKHVSTVNKLLIRNYIQGRSYDSALRYANQYLELCRKQNSPEGLRSAYSLVAFSYLWMDDDKPERERTMGSLAIPYLDSALQCANMLNTNWIKGDIYSGIGECYHRFMNPPDHALAEKYYKKAIEIAHQLVHTQSVDYGNLWAVYANGYCFLGEIYSDLGRYEMGKIYLDSSLMAVDSVYFTIDTSRYAMNYISYVLWMDMYWRKLNIYRTFNKLYLSMGDYRSAMQYQKLKEKILDSVKQIETRSQIDYLLAREENKSTQRKIQLLEQQKELEQNKAERFLYLTLGLVLLLVVAVLMIRQHRMRSVQEKMGLQQRLFRTQMNPHFIFNSLSSIQHLVVKGDPKKASIYLARFSALVRGVLYSSDKDTILIKEEIKSIESYLSLQKIRYSNKFEYTVEVDPELDTESLSMPPLLAQPFIENAIEHGIRHKEGTGHIAVRFQLNGGAVHVEVEDDGVGREKSHELEKGMKADHRSMATEITRERLRILNRKLKRKISFEISDLVDEKGNPGGTRVGIVLPVEVV